MVMGPSGSPQPRELRLGTAGGRGAGGAVCRSTPLERGWVETRPSAALPEEMSGRASPGRGLPGRRVVSAPRGLRAGRAAWCRGRKVPQGSPALFLPCQQGSERLFISVTLLRKPKLTTDGNKWAR